MTDPYRRTRPRRERTLRQDGLKPSIRIEVFLGLAGFAYLLGRIVWSLVVGS